MYAYVEVGKAGNTYFLNYAGANKNRVEVLSVVLNYKHCLLGEVHTHLHTRSYSQALVR